MSEAKLRTSEAEQAAGKTVKIAWAMTAFAVAMLWTSAAQAITTLKQVQVSNGSQVDLLFDGKVTKGQVRAEFFNDVIQVVFNDVAVYPAKISSVAEGKLAKVFAYQYAPKLVRCRLTVRGKAEDFKDQLEISPSGKMVTIRIGGGATLEPVAAKTAPKTETRAEASANAPAKGQDKNNEELVAADRALLDQVIKSQSAPAQPEAGRDAKDARDGKEKEEKSPAAQNHHKGNKAAQASTKNDSAQDAQIDSTDSRPLTGGKEGPSLVKTFGKLALVFGLLGLLFIGARAFKNRGAGGALVGGKEVGSGVMGAISRFAVKGFGQKGKLIEVIATHYLGPKRSIHVIRVAEKTLVIGVTNEAINLISELDSEEGLLSEYGDRADTAQSQAQASYAPNRPAQDRSSITDAIGPALFSQMLGAETANSGRAPSGYTSGKTAGNSESAGQGVRSRIKSKLEGLKPL